MFVDILRGCNPDKTYIVVDALDECVEGRDELLNLILKETKDLPCVKWIISSRNRITRRTSLDDSQSVLSLELQENAEFVSLAIGAYIANRLAELEPLREDETLLEYAQQAL